MYLKGGVHGISQNQQYRQIGYRWNRLVAAITAVVDSASNSQYNRQKRHFNFYERLDHRWNPLVELYRLIDAIQRDNIQSARNANSFQSIILIGTTE